MRSIHSLDFSLINVEFLFIESHFIVPKYLQSHANTRRIAYKFIILVFLRIINITSENTFLFRIPNTSNMADKTPHANKYITFHLYPQISFKELLNIKRTKKERSGACLQ